MLTIKTLLQITANFMMRSFTGEEVPGLQLIAETSDVFTFEFVFRRLQDYSNRKGWSRNTTREPHGNVRHLLLLFSCSSSETGGGHHGFQCFSILTFHFSTGPLLKHTPGRWMRASPTARNGTMSKTHNIQRTRVTAQCVS